jgi:phospholipid transport system transporter-binding protein
VLHDKALLLPQRLTADEAPGVLRLLPQAIEANTEKTWVVDASQLQEFDSAALAVLLACQRAAQAQSKTLALCHAPPKLMALARLYGVDVLWLRTADSV